MDQSQKALFLHNSTVSIVWPKIASKNFAFKLANNQTLATAIKNVSDQDLEILLANLCKHLHLCQLQGIRSIKFELSWQYQQSHFTLEFFHSLLSNHLTHIQHLSLALETTILTDKSLETFSYTIHRFLPDLKKLELDFGNCQKLTNNGLKHFIKPSFSRLRNLEELVLGFHKYEELEDCGVKLLVCGISRTFSRLKYLELDIVGAFEITDQSLKSIGYYLGKRMDKLESFVFQLLWSSQVTQSAFDELRNNLELSIATVEMVAY